MEKEKRVKYLPVMVQVRKKDAAAKHQNLVSLSQGVVRQVGPDLVEDIRPELPEPAEDGSYSVEIKPQYLNFLGPQDVRLFAKETFGEEPCRWAKVFCYLNGQRPVADFIDAEKGQAGIGGGNLVSIFTNRNETLLVSHIWIDYKSKRVMMKPMLSKFYAGMALTMFSVSRNKGFQVLHEKVKFALETCETCTGAVVHALRKVWDTNGYANKVFAVLPEEQKKSAPSPAPAKPAVDEKTKEAVGQILDARPIVADRVEKGAAPEDRIHPEQGSADAMEALKAEAPRNMTDPNKPAKKGKGKTKVMRAEADAVSAPEQH